MGRYLELTAETSAAATRDAAEILRAGGVAVFPTDTVYGIAQSVAANPDGPSRLFSIKRRPCNKVIPWLVSSLDDLARYGTRIPAYAQTLAEAFWPGALTLVVSASNEVPSVYRAADDTVALRVPASTVALSLIRQTGSALATTSANTSGMPAPVSADEIEPRIVRDADITLAAAETLVQISSTIVVCTAAGPRFSRIGALSERDVLAVLS